jgi:5-methylcytosine-specific restriction enzyme subunit McrC
MKGMSSKKTLRVSEFEKLYFDNEKTFKERHWTKLCDYLEHVNKKENKHIEYFRVLNKGIQFTNFVGVIQAGDLTIEVLPKIDRGRVTAVNDNLNNLNPEDSKEKQKWHDVLLQMLKECRLIKVNHADYANLNLKSNSILDIYLELFLNEAESLAHQGLLKKYRKNDGNQTTLKGQLIFAKNIAYNSIHQERFYVRYTEYNPNNIYNQLLYQALCLIPKLSSNAHLSDRVGRLLLGFPEMNKCTVSAEAFDRLQYDRKTERYKEALLIAKMLLLNYRPDITGGSEDMIAILFDMNKLWEEFVYRRLKKEEGNVFGDYRLASVKPQQSAEFWKPKTGYTKSIRPDVVIQYTRNDQVEVGDQMPTKTIIIDTKWKVIDDMMPSDDDLKQMFVYNLYWDCERSVLLYPAEINDMTEGDYVQFTNQCAVAVVSVLKEGKLYSEFGKMVIEHILK